MEYKLGLTGDGVSFRLHIGFLRVESGSIGMTKNPCTLSHLII